MPTLSQLHQKPAMVCRDISSLTVREISSRVKTYTEASGPAKKPEVSAITFYLANHLLADLRQQTWNTYLSKNQVELFDHYYKIVVDEVMRAFSYLYLITTREARHLSGGVSQEIMSSYPHGQVLGSFIKDLNGSPSTAMNELLNAHLEVGVGEYLDFVCDVFNKMYWSTSYGGKKWGTVTQVLRDFVYGVISPVVLLDVVFTLAHNGGPIFNKNVLYHTYSNLLIPVLDVQRSGQIPALVSGVELNSVGGTYPQPQYDFKKVVLPEHQVLLDFGQFVLGVKYPKAIDWNKAKNLGALGTYTSPKKPVSVSPGNKGATSITEEEMFQVTPLVKVPKLTRKQVKKLFEEEKHESDQAT